MILAETDKFETQKELLKTETAPLNHVPTFRNKREKELFGKETKDYKPDKKKARTRSRQPSHEDKVK